jgi:putative peptidoglycan lipid II flippase
LKSSFLRIETVRKGIVLSSGFNLLAKVLGFVQNIVLAYYFGAQAKTDIVFFSLTLISLLSSFLGLLTSSVIIPESIRMLQDDDQHKYHSFLNVFFLGYVAIAGFASTICFYEPVQSVALISRFSHETLAQSRLLIQLASPLFVLMVGSQYMIDVLTSRRYFTMPMLSSIANSAIVLVAVFLLRTVADVSSILIGLLVAYAIQCILLVALLRRRLAWTFGITPSPIRKLVWHNLGFSQLGNVFSFLSSYAPILVFSGFSPGVVTALNYGQKVSDLPGTIITNQVSSVIGVRFNELCAKGEFDKLNQVFLKSTRSLVFILMPIVGLAFALSEDLIRLLFGRGAFSEESVSQSALFLRYLTLVVPATAIVAMGARLFMALQIINRTFWLQIFSNVLLIGLLLLLVNEFGIIGYPLSFLIVNALNVVANGWFVRRYCPSVKYNTLYGWMVEITLLNAGLVLAVIMVFKVISISPVVRILVGTTGYLVVLVILNHVLRLEREVNVILWQSITRIRQLLVPNRGQS